MKPRTAIIVVVVIILFWLCLQDETNQTLGKAQNMTIQEEFEQWIDSVLADRQPKGEYRIVGTLPVAVILKLIELQTVITTPEIIITDEKVLHALREVKQNRGQAISDSDLKMIINTLQNPDLILYDHEEFGIIFIRKKQKGKNIKFVCKPNRTVKMSRKKEKINLIVTAGLINDNDLKNLRYEII